MIEVELKINSKTLWADMKNNPKIWSGAAIQIAAAVLTLVFLKKVNYFAVVSYHIQNGSLTTQFKESYFWWCTIWLFVCCVVPLIVFIYTLPPIMARRTLRQYPDIKSTLIFDEEKIVNNHFCSGVNTNTDFPYNKINKVTRKNGCIFIKLGNMVTIFDNCFINGTPAELEALLKEKCADKCNF